MFFINALGLFSIGSYSKTTGPIVVSQCSMRIPQNWEVRFEADMPLSAVLWPKNLTRSFNFEVLLLAKIYQLFFFQRKTAFQESIKNPEHTFSVKLQTFPVSYFRNEFPRLAFCVKIVLYLNLFNIFLKNYQLSCSFPVLIRRPAL